MTETTSQESAGKPAHPVKSRPAWKRTLFVTGILITALVFVNAAYISYLYAASPLSIREPLYEHYHYRMQVLVDGKPLDFGNSKFQEGYAKDNCNAALTAHPIHFHDSKDQFVHIHWEGMTGGQVLKYYGWNFIGGTDGSLGYRFDSAPKLQKVPIHGNVLPALPSDAQFYVYSGDEDGYKKREFKDYTEQDLEKFFGKASNSPAHELNKEKRGGWLNKLTPKAYAQEQASGLSDEELTRLNNLIGNVVIFVQKNQPSDQQVKDRFNALEPLTESSCGG